MKPIVKYYGIIFDLDGTLADTLEDIAGSMNRVLKSHGFPARPVNDYRLLVGRGLDNLVKQSLPDYARENATVNACLSELITDYNENCLIKTHLYEGIHPLLNELVRLKIRMAVFSNKAEPLTIKIVTALLPGFDFVSITGARVDLPKKPDPAGAIMISRMMDIPSEKIIYVGDSDVDMITATKAGMFAVGVSWGFRSIDELQENGADLIINSPGQLLSFFQDRF